MNNIKELISKLESIQSMTANQLEAEVNETEMDIEEGPKDNFTADDIKELERINDLDELKQRAIELISSDSERPMKPEKIEYFTRQIGEKTNKMAVIKVMYDLLLSGEGMGVVGGSRRYRQRFGENTMKDLLRIVSESIETDLSECPMDDAMPAPVHSEQPDTVSMSINMNGTGSKGIRDLLAVLRDLDKMGDVEEPHRGEEPPKFDSSEMDIIMSKEEFANEPDEAYGDVDDVTASGDDLHKSKDSFKPTNGGDNPMSLEDSIKERLAAKLESLKNQ